MNNAGRPRIIRRTVFSTPILTPCLRLIARGLLRLIGWRCVGTTPEKQHFVLIGAPHTSNWDFPLMLMAVLLLRLRLNWMGKDTLFRFPFGGLMRWLGGITIDRSRSHNMVGQIAQMYKSSEELVILIPPEGTRKKVEHWKTGFYHIANNAGVPILLGYIDCNTRQLGLADFFQPSGDIEADMVAIRSFYADKRGVRPENA